MVSVRKFGVKLNSRSRKILKLVFGLPRKTADSFVVAFEDDEAFLIKKCQIGTLVFLWHHTFLLNPSPIMF